MLTMQDPPQNVDLVISDLHVRLKEVLRFELDPALVNDIGKVGLIVRFCRRDDYGKILQNEAKIRELGEQW